jgi:hypothetical protein
MGQFLKIPPNKLYPESVIQVLKYSIAKAIETICPVI